MEWVCDYCHGVMEESGAGRNRKKISCPTCGTYWYVDRNDEYINDGSAWSPDDEDYEDDE